MVSLVQKASVRSYYQSQQGLKFHWNNVYWNERFREKLQFGVEYEMKNIDYKNDKGFEFVSSHDGAKPKDFKQRKWVEGLLCRSQKDY